MKHINKKIKREISRKNRSKSASTRGKGNDISKGIISTGTRNKGNRRKNNTSKNNLGKKKVIDYMKKDKSKKNQKSTFLDNTQQADKSNQTEKLYLVLVSTPGIFATIIKMVTRLKYIHIVLGMDEDLTECYSFGRRNPKIPFFSGFEKEEMDKVVEHFPKALCMVTEINCTPEQKEQVWGRINYYKANAKRYHYTILGLPFILINRPFHQKRRYACSQFVARTLEDYHIRHFEKHYSLMTPRDFYEMPEKKILYVGTIEGYLDSRNGYKKYYDYVEKLQRQKEKR